MFIPYYIFLILYLLGTGIVLLFALSSLFHLLKFGFFSPTSVFMTFILMAGMALILFISYQYLSPIDWQQELDVWEFMQTINPFS